MIFRGDFSHAGAEYGADNLRIHLPDSPLLPRVADATFLTGADGNPIDLCGGQSAGEYGQWIALATVVRRQSVQQPADVFQYQFARRFVATSGRPVRGDS